MSNDILAQKTGENIELGNPGGMSNDILAQKTGENIELGNPGGTSTDILAQKQFNIPITVSMT